MTSAADRWVRWHDAYDDPTSAQTRRLRLVQQQIRLMLDAAPAGPIRVLSLCAGQGRDLLEVLRDHPRRADVTARLVELDPRLIAVARGAAAGIDGAQIEIVEGDAGTTDACVDAVPAGLVLLAGIFGNAHALRGRRDRHLDAQPASAGPDPGDQGLVHRRRCRGGHVHGAGRRALLGVGRPVHRRTATTSIRAPAVHVRRLARDTGVCPTAVAAHAPHAESTGGPAPEQRSSAS
jgi:SAM-dependent methyltransferase